MKELFYCTVYSMSDGGKHKKETFTCKRLDEVARCLLTFKVTKGYQIISFTAYKQLVLDI